MQTTPKSLRLHIALMGRVNSGKSSFLNLICGQDVAITSAQEGTTTDIVEKTQELSPLGPVVWLDTAGYGDKTELSSLRLQKTQAVFDRADIILLICEGNNIGSFEQEIMAMAQERKIPLIKIYNKADIFSVDDSEGILVNSRDKSSRDEVLNKLKAALIKVCPDEFVDTPTIFGDLAPAQSFVVMIVPIDFEAPKGRLILPQVQAIRDGLDNSQIISVVKESEYIKCYRDAFQKLNINPNKFMCSIEALLTRISKKKGMPEINSIVDLVNAVSIKYKLPMGAHDLDSMNNEDFYIRYSVNDDTFLPFGETETEKVDNNELVYAVAHDIRTRRWIWRQSEYGKITENSSNIIFPIDAFIGINDDKAIKARDELAELLAKFFNCDIKTGIIDSKNNYIEF